MKPSAPRCRSYEAVFPTTNKQVFSGGDTAVLYIPARRNCFLDTQQSQFRFTIKNVDTTNDLKIDGSAYSFINNIAIYHGSNRLEQINQIDVLAAYLVDFQLDQAKRAGLEIEMGTTADRAGTQITKSNYQATFNLPVLSGVIGTLMDKYLPLSLADDLRVEITLNTAALSGCWSTTTAITTGWSCLNFEMLGVVVELSDSAMAMVEQVSPFNDTIYMHGTSWQSYVSNLVSGASGRQSFLVPARFASLKSLVLCPRRATEIASQNSYSISSRANCNFSEFSWMLGSLQVPQRPNVLKNSNTTGGYSIAHLGCLRSFHSLGNYDITGSIPADYFNIAESADSTAKVAAIATANTGTSSYKNAFAIAQELESFANRNDVVLTGLNTLSANTFFQANIDTATSTAYTLNFFACYDHILQLDPTGLFSVKY
jgi:hypothetical protein